jgi:hypothetical protein
MVFTRGATLGRPSTLADHPSINTPFAQVLFRLRFTAGAFSFFILSQSGKQLIVGAFALVADVRTPSRDTLSAIIFPEWD